ncbi:MAG: TolC family protein [Pirellulales bacterium]
MKRHIPIALLAVLMGACTAPTRQERSYRFADPGGGSGKLPTPTAPAKAADRPPAANVKPTGVPPRATTVDQAMTFEQVLQYSLEHHPLLKARQYEVEAARAKLTTAGLLPNPRFVMDSRSPTAKDDPTELTARVMFTVQTAGKRRLAQSVAEADIQRAAVLLSKETERVLMEAVDAANEVLYLQELAVLDAQFSDLAAMSAKMAQEKLKGGGATEVESLLTEVNAVDIESDRLKTINKLEASRLRLARAMGVPELRPVSIQGKLAVEPVPPVPLDAVLATARQRRPDLAEAEAEVVLRRQQLALAYAKARPDFEIGPRFHESFRDTDSLGVRFEMDLPVFDRNQGGICQRAAQVQSARALADAAELASLGDVAAVYVQLEPLQSRLRYYETDVLPLATRTENVLRDAIAAQTIDPSALSNHLMKLGKMRMDYLELRYLYNHLRMRLELFLGCRLGDLAQETTNGQAAATPQEPPRKAKTAPNSPRS